MLINRVEFESSNTPLVSLQDNLVLTHAELSRRVKKGLDHQVKSLISNDNLRIGILSLPRPASEYEKAKEVSDGYVEKRVAKLFCAQAKMEEYVLQAKQNWGDRVLVPIRNAFNGAMSSLYSTKLWLTPTQPGQLEKLHIMNSLGHCVGMSRTFEHLCLRVREKKGVLNRDDAIRIAGLLSGGATEEAAIEQSGEMREGGCRDGFFVVPIVLTPQMDLSPGYLSYEQISSGITKQFGIYDFMQGRHRMALLQTDDGFSLLFEPQGGLIDITDKLNKVFEFESFKNGNYAKEFNLWKEKYTAAREALLKEVFSNENGDLGLIEAVRTMLDNWITSEDKGFLYRRFSGVGPKLWELADAIFRTVEDKLPQKFMRICLAYYQIANVALRPATLPQC